ncbi:CAP domain-containing protein [Thermoanaerobacterium thermosaccharolyticum]|uniref:CAP domain-containing protein n=1 Tax=Thermoanaerobacterium thermosaccharolyticum TaxID=1517 RepID=UPI003D26DB6F
MNKKLKYYATFAVISLSVLSPFATAKASYPFGTYTKNNVVYNTTYVANSSNVNMINYSGFNTAPIKINYLNSTNNWYNNNYWWITTTIGTSKSNQTVINPPTAITPTTSTSTIPAGNGQATNENNSSIQNYQGSSAQEKQLVDLINKERTSRGLSPLTIDENLSKVAHIKAEDMKGNNYFSHTSPTYGSPFDMMKQFGISYNAAAENIAENSDVVSAHYALMNSSGHRDNILNPYFNKVGVGIISNSTDNGVIVVEMFINQ